MSAATLRRFLALLYGGAFFVWLARPAAGWTDAPALAVAGMALLVWWLAARYLAPFGDNPALRAALLGGLGFSAGLGVAALTGLLLSLHAFVRGLPLPGDESIRALIVVLPWWLLAGGFAGAGAGLLWWGWDALHHPPRDIDLP